MTRFHIRTLFIPVFITFLTLTACEKTEEPAAVAVTQEQPQTETWEQFVTRQIEAQIAAHPQWAVTQGRHEYDGQLPDWSRGGIEKEITRLHQARDEAMAFADDQMSAEQLYQREYLVSRVDQDLFWMEKVGQPFRSPQYYLGWMSDSLDPSAYIALDYAPLEERMKAFTRYLENVPTAVKHIRQNLAMPMPRTWLQLGIDSFGGYAAYFRDDVPAVWAAVEDEELHVEECVFRISDNGGGSAGWTVGEWFVNGSTAFTSKATSDERPWMSWVAIDLVDRVSYHEITVLKKGDLIRFDIAALPTGGSPAEVEWSLVCRVP